MKKARVKVAYGNRSMTFSLPSSRFLGTLANKPPVRRDIRALLDETFNKPLAGRTLESVLKNKRSVLIVVPDDTRHAHLKTILPYLLRKMTDKSLAIHIIVATGLHKIHTDPQLKKLLGSSVVKKYKVLSHELGNGDIVKMGSTSKGVPITLDRNLFKHDVVLSIGVIEPHLYAGYSGGAKTVAIGLAGEDTINDTHGVRFLDDPKVAIGSIENNPFQQALREIVKKVPLAFSVNVVNDQEGRAVKVFCGETESVFGEGVKFARHIYEVTARKPADIVICGVGYPKDINIYQASRAINYIANVDRPVIRRGGVLIVAAELREGIGESPAEIKFYETLKSMGSPEAFISGVKRCGCKAGEHRAYMVAGPLRNYNIVFVSGAASSALMKGLPFMHFTKMSDAIDYADSVVGPSAKVYAIPHALATVARAR